MKKFISVKTAANASLIIYTLFFVFHIFVIIGIIPFNIVWGGRIHNRSDLFIFEIISLTILSIFIFFTMIKVGYINISFLKFISNIVMWFIFILFILNTIGNLFAVSIFEKIAFTPITALLSLFSLRLIMEKQANKKQTNK